MLKLYRKTSSTWSAHWRWLSNPLIEHRPIHPFLGIFFSSLFSWDVWCLVGINVWRNDSFRLISWAVIQRMLLRLVGFHSWIILAQSTVMIASKSYSIIVSKPSFRYFLVAQVLHFPVFVSLLHFWFARQRRFAMVWSVLRCFEVQETNFLGLFTVG